MGKTHTDREYEKELRGLRESLLLMAGLVEQMIVDSMRALIERDTDLAMRTIKLDNRVNRLEIATDEACLVVLAKRQPMASDLRFITRALKMVTDLERIGDLAVNICERAVQLASEAPLSPPESVIRMGDVLRSMVGDAIGAFVDGDIEKAQAVIARDDEMDELYHVAFGQVLTRMLADPTLVHRGIHVHSVAKFLERMGDHATNLAEEVVFLLRGTDVRHRGKLGNGG